MKRVLKWAARLLLLVLIIAFVWGFIAYWTSKSGCEQITAAPANPMKAILKCEYGVDGLKLREIEKPVPNDNQVVIKVQAASLNAFDSYMLRGAFFLRPFTGLRKPTDARIGVDVAGTVESVGKNITKFKPGNDVFGTTHGSFAEYALGSERGLALKPADVPFEQAGAVSLAGLTALQGLRNGNIQAGQKVLINGASGGVGTFAVQLAKAFGTEVTAVCSTRNVDLVRSIGADHVIDYTKEDFTKGSERYGLIFDNVSNHSFSARRRVLKPNGICVLVGIGGAGPNLAELMPRIIRNFTSSFRSRFVKEKFVSYITKSSPEDLRTIAGLIQAGKVRPVIERTYKLSETADALRQLEGHARGKIVITID